MDIYCKVTPYGLIPLYDSDFELQKRLQPGKVVRARITLPRNYQFHKKFFALVRLTFENLPTRLAEEYGIGTEDDMLRRFKRDLGYFKSSYNEKGEREIEYRSISFTAMDQEEFERFYSQCIDLVTFRYIRGIDRETLLEEIENFR